jgi:hypothetical protein
MQKVQKNWDTPLVDAIQRWMLAAAGLRNKARLMALPTEASRTWFNAMPISTLGNLLNDDSSRVSVAVRLDALVCWPHKCRCGGYVEASGHHDSSCKRSVGRSTRYSSLNDVVKRVLVSASVHAILGLPGLECENGKRPDGMTLVSWKQGKALVWDVTCVDSLVDSHIIGSITSAGLKAVGAERKKTNKYRNLVEGRFIFSPLALETLGLWGPKSKALTSTIGQKITKKTRETSHLIFKSAN